MFMLAPVSMIWPSKPRWPASPGTPSTFMKTSPLAVAVEARAMQARTAVRARMRVFICPSRARSGGRCSGAFQG
jgi:hypothetical protein